MSENKFAITEEQLLEMLKREFDLGRDRGYQLGYDEGYNKGVDDGYKNAQRDLARD